MRLSSTETLLFAAIFLTLLYIGSPHAAVSQAVGPPQLVNSATTSCTASGAKVAFSWTPVEGATAYWLDVSLQDNNFAPGTFVGNGPLDAKKTDLAWDGFQSAQIYFWRVNALTPSGWSVSETRIFVPCGGSTLRTSAITCEGDGTATVTFRWAPSSTPSQVQYLDLSVFDNGFAAGTHLTTGALSPQTAEITWPGIRTDTPHYFRITSLTQQGWQTTRTGSIVACPSAHREPGTPPAIPGPETPGERWIRVDIERQEATAMIGDTPLYTALVTTGKEGWETPRGTFSIVYRVENETMTSESIGAEEYYVLKDVLYTQYFTYEGHALHLNYWRPDYYFGEIPSSHGCVGIRLEAAEFFWRFATYGTRVTVI